MSINSAAGGLNVEQCYIKDRHGDFRSAGAMLSIAGSMPPGRRLISMIERAEEGGLKAAAELAFLPEKPSRPAREIVVVKT